MASSERNISALASSLIGIISILFGMLVVFTIGLVSLFASFLATQSIPLNSDTVASVGLIYGIVGSILVSYDAIAGTGILAQLSWYLKRIEKSLIKRWLMIFYLLSLPLDKNEPHFDPVLNDIKRGRDMRNADFSERAAGESPRAESKYDQFRSIQRAAVIRSFGFTFIFIGFLMQFVAIYAY